MAAGTPAANLLAAAVVSSMVGFGWVGIAWIRRQDDKIRNDRTPAAEEAADSVLPGTARTRRTSD